jgi:Fic family protein
MAYDRQKPNNDLPPVPPRGVELETKAVLKRAIAANKVLAELKGVAEVIPNPMILLRSIMLQEARVSSEIENIVTTNDEVYRALNNTHGGGDPGAKEVVGYQQALWTGMEALKSRPLSTNVLVDVVRQIKGMDLGIRKIPGTALKNPTGHVIYTPPTGEDLIREKLADLERFIHGEEDLDPLVKLAILHYQFEAIHPFPDGNGRTGRILNILFLISQGLLDLPVLYLSRYIIRNKGAYYEGLRQVTEEHAWEPWILYMLAAVEATARDTRDRILKIRELMEQMRRRIQDEAPALYSKDLVEVLFQNPYCKVAFLEQAGLARRQTASTYLKILEGRGILKGFKAGRERYYMNLPLMELLTS